MNKVIKLLFVAIFGLTKDGQNLIPLNSIEA